MSKWLSIFFALHAVCCLSDVACLLSCVTVKVRNCTKTVTKWLKYSHSLYAISPSFTKSTHIINFFSLFYSLSLSHFSSSLSLSLFLSCTSFTLSFPPSFFRACHHSHSLVHSLFLPPSPQFNRLQMLEMWIVSDGMDPEIFNLKTFFNLRGRFSHGSHRLTWFSHGS